MAKILVTGGTGYIGSHTVLELIEAGHEVVIVDNLSNSKLEVLNRIEAINGVKVEFHEVDLLNKEDLRAVFENDTFDAVIHFAGLKAVGESVSIPIKYYHNNITGSLILFELMSEYGVKNLVFSSSATVYGMNNVSPLTETLPLSTTNPYGTTKLFIEQITEDLVASDDEWSVVNLRYFNPIGAHKSGTMGEDPAGIPNNLMPYVTQVAVGKREKLTVFGDDYDTVDGTGVRDYIHVVDLAKGHVKALEYGMKHRGVEAINLGSGQGTSVIQLVAAFEQSTGAQVPYEIGPRRPGDIGTCFASAAKAKELLDWETEKTVVDMCQDSWNWQSKNPTGY